MVGGQCQTTKLTIERKCSSPTNGNRSREVLLDIPLAVDVVVDVLASAERRPLRLILEESHGMHILNQDD